MADLEENENPVQERKTAGRELVFLAVLIGAGMAVLVFWMVRSGGGNGERLAEVEVSRKPGDRFVGPLACRDCHLGIYSQFVKSGHARTIRPAADRELAKWLTAQVVADPEKPDVTWSYELRGDELVVIRGEGEKSEEQVVDYAIGSGHHATTFLSLPGENPALAMEHRLTYYAHLDGLGITPGQEAYDPALGTGELGRQLSVEFTYLCFACHTTITSAEDLTRVDVKTMMPNVTCERCHGPGKSHVEAANREAMDLSMPFGKETGPQRWTAQSQLRMCGGCHRLPEMVSPDVIRADNPELARFQPAALMQSACYKQSAGRMHCLTCHDPHRPAETEARFYERKCLECHTKARGQTECASSPGENCLECHMPAKDAGQGVLFTDHWIRVVE